MNAQLRVQVADMRFHGRGGNDERLGRRSREHGLRAITTAIAVGRSASAHL